jgi:hypothetical protein
LGVYGKHQVGYAVVDGCLRASLWYGSADSWVDLTPAGAWKSKAHAAHGVWQVGYAQVGYVYHASLWSGDAEFWVDLHQFLSQEFFSSEAHGICEDSGVIYVVGWGFNRVANRVEALMWVMSERDACLRAQGLGSSSLR